MSEAVKKWYLVYAKPRQERVARTNLERQGYETYLPLSRETKRRRGRATEVIAPLFPRYLFIHLDSQTDDWGPIRSTLGVVSLVRFAYQPAQVPDDLVATLRAREDSEGLVAVPRDVFKRGGRVRITDGSFMGYEGIFLASTGRDRVVILLDIMGKLTRATVGSISIEPAS
mgnify:FL=1